MTGLQMQQAAENEMRQMELSAERKRLQEEARLKAGITCTRIGFYETSNGRIKVLKHMHEVCGCQGCQADRALIAANINKA